MVMCSIADSGPDISPEHLIRLFESFFTTKEGGTGMGLRIAGLSSRRMAAALLRTTMARKAAPGSR